MKELLLFQAGNIQFGLDLPLVKSIHSVNARFAEQAGRSHRLVQVMDGEEFPLYDLPTIFGDVTSSGDPMSQKVILVEAQEHPIALGVDRVERVVSVNSDRIQPLPPIFKGLPLSCFPKVLKHEDELILLLNPEGISDLKPEIPDTETYTPKPETMESSLEEKETPKPMAQAASNISEIPQDSSQKSEISNGELTSGIPYSESTPPGEIEREQSDLDDYLSETFDIDPDFEEETTSRFVKEAMIAWEELPKIEPFQPEKSILYDEQEQFGSELLAIDAGLENLTPDTEDSDAHDAEEETAVADVEETAAETSPDEDKVETGVEGGHFETASVEPTTKSYEVVPGETQYAEGKNEVDEENRLFSFTGISLDSKGESGSPFEGGKPLAYDALSQVAVVQPEEIVSFKEADVAVETPEVESTDHLPSAEEDKAAPLLPVREVPYLLAAVSTESEPISIEPDDFILSDSSDTIKSAYGNQSKRALTPSEIPQKLELDHGKRKSLRQGLVAVGMLALVALLSLSMWLWLMSTPRIPEVVIKPIPLFYKIREVREKPEELSQIPQPLNTGEKATGTAHTSLMAGAEVFKIETNDFTLTVERPKATEKNGWPPASVGMTGENEHSHIVMKNDTLWEIAKRYLDDPFRYLELAERSRINNPDRIYPGDVVRIINKNKQLEGKERKSSQERSKDGNR